MEIFDYLFLLFVVYLGTEFCTYLIALALVSNGEDIKNVSAARAAFDFRKNASRSEDLKNTKGVKLLNFLNRLRIILKIFFIFFFVLLVGLFLFSGIR